MKIMEHIIRKYKPSKNSILTDLASKPISKLTEKEKEKQFNSIGLEQIAKHLSTLSNGRLTQCNDIRAPQKKLYVMIIGNHSAGKSSFINWYIGEKLQ